MHVLNVGIRLAKLLAFLIIFSFNLTIASAGLLQSIPDKIVDLPYNWPDCGDEGNIRLFSSFDIDNDWLVIGTTSSQKEILCLDFLIPFEPKGGKVSLYKKINSEWQFITSWQGENDDNNFGYSVAVSGNTIAVGAPYEKTENENANGAAYIFNINEIDEENANLQFIKKIPLNYPAYHFSGFGYSIDLEGNHLAIGAPFFSNDQDGSNIGLVKIYEKDQGGNNNWGWIQDLFYFDGSYQQFGYSITMQENLLAVGMPSPYTDSKGTVVVYKLSGNTWIIDDFITPSDIESESSFGSSVSFSNNILAVGDPWKPGFGSVYLFEKEQNSDWIQTDQVFIPEQYKQQVQGGPEFGNSISIYGDSLLVGALRYDFIDYYNEGAAFLYRKQEPNNWKFERMLTAADYDPDEEDNENALFANQVLLNADGAFINRLNDYEIFHYHRAEIFSDGFEN